METPPLNKHKLIITLILIFLLSAAGYSAYGIFTLTKTKQNLENELSELTLKFASTTASLALTADDLEKTKIERDQFQRDYEAEKSRMDFFSAQIQGVQSAVGVIEKLRKMDPEWLKKYSKVYFLNENYIPAKLAPTEPQYSYQQDKEQFLHADVVPFLRELLDDAERAEMGIKIISAYRSFDTQAGLKSVYSITYGTGANQFSADQGYSEHQLGTTVDFTTEKTGADFSAFEYTPAYKWLGENAYRYGFALSYPKNNAYYKFEPWHWRFVGKGLAAKLHSEKKYFYDLEQREIDAYLLSFFDQ